MLSVLDEVDDDFCRRYAELVAARARRIPLQHIVGSAPLGPVTVEVGPGVFIPRPETEGCWNGRRRSPFRRDR